MSSPPFGLLVATHEIRWRHETGPGHTSSGPGTDAVQVARRIHLADR